ncbi:MAG: PKD domain-containing protein, partial [Prolixibacteraceae bacterium]
IPSKVCCWDHLYEQIPPLHSWGREYFTVPLKSREQDRFRIMAANNNTTVNITGRAPFVLNRGEFTEQAFSHEDPKHIIADKPILVAQFSQSNHSDSTFTGGDGDPFMMILSSTAQTKNDVTFVAYKSPDIDFEKFEYSGIQKYFINVIAKTEDVPGMVLNAASLQDKFRPFPDNPDYSYLQKEIEQGTHRLRNLNPEGKFLAYVYGFGGLESYGYGIGFNLDLMLDLGESFYFERDTLLLCRGDTLTLDAGGAFDSFNWSTGEITQRISVTEAGWYSVRAATAEGCALEDSVYVFESKPETVPDKAFYEECAPFSVELSGADGYEKYLWQNDFGDTLSTEQTITADQNGIYRITVFDEYNCTAGDQTELLIHPTPNVEVTSDDLVCGSNTTALSVEISGAPDSIWNFTGNFEWTAGAPGQLSFSSESRTSVNVEAGDWGDYQVYYNLTTIDGCTVTDTLPVSFYPIPTSDFEFADDAGNECSGYTREIIYTGDAEQDANFLWDFGGSKVIDSIDWNNFIVSMGTLTNNPVLQLVVEQNGCYSEPERKIIGSNPDFRMETDNFRGCDSLQVTFRGEVQIPDELLFEWDFGDGSPIRNEKNPTHFYSKPGMYDVDLTVTNQNSGCQIGFHIDSMVKVFPTPVADISTDPDFCYPDTTQIFYTFGIDSTIAYWQFEGMHQVGEGNDSITVVFDEPVSNVKLTIDEFGCISNTAEMELKRKPNFDFTIDDTEGCEPFAAEITAEPFDDMLSFNWITDSLPFPAGTTHTFLFPDSGRYDIGLIAHSAQTGCTDTLIKNDWIWVHTKPTADFTVNYQTALLERSTITFSNFSTNAGFYYWDLGDNTLTNEKSPEHTYTEIGEYDVTLIAESVFGCTDTAEYQIDIIPNARFTPNAFRPDSPIDVNRTFMPVGRDGFQSNFSLQIYNRWGELVFETNSVNNPWDGTTPDGNPAPMGNYVWIATYTDVQGFEQRQKGQVLLLR